MKKNLFDSLKYDSNIGLFDDIKNDFLAGDYIEAKNKNLSLADENLIELNKKTVYEIYFRTVAISLPITAQDSSNLLYIANQNSITSGTGVYAARALLSLDVEEDYFSSLRKKGEHLNNSHLIISVNPNPSSSELNIIGINEEETIKICINDITGRLIISIILNKKRNIDITCLNSGLYHISLFRNDIKIYSSKIVVMK